MSRLVKKIGFMIVLIVLLTTSFSIKIVYANTEEEELKEMLDECKTDLGDLTEFKQVIDKIYNDLISATIVDESLKTELRADIKELSTVTGIDPIVLATLDIEFNSQVDGLTDENLSEMQKEFAVIKEWVDEQPEANNNTNDFTNQDEDMNQNIGNSNMDTQGNTNQQVDNGESDKIITIPEEIKEALSSNLPKTGRNAIIIICAILIMSCVAIISIIKYKKLNGI